MNFDIPSCGSIQNQMADIRNIRKNPKSETSPFVTGFKWHDISPETEETITKLVQIRSVDRRNGMR